LFYFWVPKVQKSPFPIDFPQDDPDPCPGYILILFYMVFIFWIDLNSIEANCFSDKLLLTARSGRPTSFRKIVSPLNKTSLWPLLFINTKQLLSSVCPGVCQH